MQMSLLQNYANKYKMTLEQVKEFYEIEKQLASKLRNSTKEERQKQHLYTSLYDELYRRVPCHPQLTQKRNPEDAARGVARTMRFLSHFLNPNVVFLEVGPGDCSLSLEVAKHVKQVYAVDVSNEITKDLTLPPNFKLVISDGVSIPVAENSVNIIYSDQLMEHLHPDDAIDQLHNICKALTPGGVYICRTPSRLSGPHDVSQCFDEVATGFHLKEYSITDLYKLFRTVGFTKISIEKNFKGIHVKIPLFSLTRFAVKVIEKFISKLPFDWRRKIAKTSIILNGITIVGQK